MRGPTKAVCLALAIVSMGLTPTAAADDHPWEPADPVLEEWQDARDAALAAVLDVVSTATDPLPAASACDVLGAEQGSTAWECFQYWFCGDKNCIRKMVWAP